MLYQGSPTKKRRTFKSSNQKLGTQTLIHVLKDDLYFGTINYINIMMNPDLRKVSRSQVQFKDKDEDDDAIRTVMSNVPSQSAISIRFRISFLEMDSGTIS